MSDEKKIVKPTTEELKHILEQHKKWRSSGGSEGARANLAGANLAGANLADAYLAGANLADAYLAGANLAGANLTRADLTDADLTDANLTRAHLRGANLADAYLAGANLRSANLRDANLADANLADANLTGANLAGANLAGANLTGAKIESTTIIETGESWADYLEKVVPVLLTAGGKTIKQILRAGAWGCHSWSNCPMAEAFGIHAPKEGPILLRPRIDQFVRYFDAKMIPEPAESCSDCGQQ